MQTLIKHIKAGTFSSMYLLYGEEEYLKRYYRDQLTKGILGDVPDGNINYHYYEGDSAVPENIADQAQCLPFFSDSMLIVIENSGLFKKAGNLNERLKDMPETTRIIFIEREIDKRNSLYKYIKSNGTLSELNYRKDTELVTWVATYLKQAGCVITGRAARHLIAKAGVDMRQLINELDKLIAYVDERHQIDIMDVDAICTTLLSSRIFVMMDNIVSGKQKEALTLYRDLLSLKENPLSILYLLTRHYNILMQVKEMITESDAVIAKKLSLPSFAIKKYKSQAGAYNKRQLLNIVTECTDTEEAIKCGRISQQIGTELLIIRFSSLL